ncbi:MAG: acyltransferase family protein [Clostridia bacterium]|nr:acyltransferase family protein [Clostridia bacterium]
MPGGWYIGTTVVLYVITPIVFNALKKFKSKTVFLILTSVLSVGIWAIFYIFLGKRFDISKGFTKHIFFVQYPCYLSGIILYEIVNRKEAKSKHSVFIFVAGLILTVVSLGLYYIPYFYGYYLSIWSMSAGICMVVYYCALAENNMKFFDSIIGKTVIAFGKKSYNIYLTHAFVVYIFIFAVEKVVNRVGFSIKNTIGFLIFIPIVILLSYLLGNLFGKVVNLFNKLWSKLPFGF